MGIRSSSIAQRIIRALVQRAHQIGRRVDAARDPLERVTCAVCHTWLQAKDLDHYRRLGHLERTTLLLCETCWFREDAW
jgi:hypothetical protein